nr:tRNA uridine-5-carboxymethylaminomethyl(34) synthesis GTPase MnmE [Pseudomonadales bacterium]
DDVLPISAMTGFGMEQLKAAIKSKLAVETVVESGFTARTRHVSALQRALTAVERGALQLETNSAAELLAEELKQCQACLSEITGEFSADALLGEIFSSFCIGK